ncbi:MAG: helix-turn-helix domain-containing protein [Pseudonocardiaceae bacterium]
MSLPDAAQVLGISRAHAYALAKRGELGVRVLRLGNRFVVPTAELWREVGLEPDPGGSPQREASTRTYGVSVNELVTKAAPGDS